MTFYRTTAQLRQMAWEWFEVEEHNRLEVNRLWDQYARTHGRDALSRSQFMALHVSKDAIEDQKFAERLVILYTAMFEMESAWQEQQERVLARTRRDAD